MTVFAVNKQPYNTFVSVSVFVLFNNTSHFPFGFQVFLLLLDFSSVFLSFCLFVRFFLSFLPSFSCFDLHPDRMQINIFELFVFSLFSSFLSFCVSFSFFHPRSWVCSISSQQCDCALSNTNQHQSEEEAKRLWIINWWRRCGILPRWLYYWWCS